MKFRDPIASDIEPVRQAMQATKDLAQYKRLQCVYLGDTQPYMSVSEIASTVGFSTSYVFALYRKFRLVGMDCVKDTRGGRHHEYLSVEQEVQLLEQFAEPMSAGQLSVIAPIKCSYEQAVGRTVACSTIYRLLIRHGFRKIVPYQRHPRHNEEQKVEYKKNSIKS